MKVQYVEKEAWQVLLPARPLSQSMIYSAVYRSVQRYHIDVCFECHDACKHAMQHESLSVSLAVPNK